MTIMAYRKNMRLSSCLRLYCYCHLIVYVGVCNSYLLIISSVTCLIIVLIFKGPGDIFDHSKTHQQVVNELTNLSIQSAHRARSCFKKVQHVCYAWSKCSIVVVIPHPLVLWMQRYRIYLSILQKHESCEDSHCNITYLMAANEICSSQQCNTLVFEAPYDAAYDTAYTATGWGTVL